MPQEATRNLRKFQHQRAVGAKNRSSRSSLCISSRMVLSDVMLHRYAILLLFRLWRYCQYIRTASAALMLRCGLMLLSIIINSRKFKPGKWKIEIIQYMYRHWRPREGGGGCNRMRSP